jgi:hypothetical protein
MRHLCAIAATLAMSSQAVAYDMNTINCENAASAQFKKDQDALYAKIGPRPITVQEVMADRRLTEAYCLKQATCSVADKPELLGQNFQSCLEQDAQEHQRAMDDLTHDAQ